MSEAASSIRPLIVTADLPGEMQARMDELRRAYYPPERNRVKAHVTLFHALPPSAEPEVRNMLARVAKEMAPPQAHVEGVMPLDQGTAVKLQSASLLGIWDELAESFHGLLSAQDLSRPRLHVTVQNKVSAKEAKTLQIELAPRIDFAAFRFSALSLYAYCGGPWEALGRWPFRGRAIAH